MSEPLWIFGYGSLIFRPAFEFEERVVGRVVGYERRFWQASTDHRGTVDRPGRVVTLVEVEGGECWGVAYRVREERREEILSVLQVREQGGYSIVTLPFERRGRGSGPKEVQVYLGTSKNPQFTGPADERDIAAIILESEGPSGHNVEYVLRLAESLAELDVVDPHVLRLANLIVDPSDVLLGE